MTYAIGNIVYGIDLTYETGWLKNLGEGLKEDIFDGHTSITTAYSGSGDLPMWLGITLGRIDECNTVNVTKITKHLPISDEVKKKWDALIAGLDIDIRDILLEHFGQNPEHPDASGGLTLQPEVLIIWSTS